jgi:hypothetical protein
LASRNSSCKAVSGFSASEGLSNGLIFITMGEESTLHNF